MRKNIRYSEIKRNKGFSDVKELNVGKGFSKQKGFSVVEVVIVIAVIGILATVLIPTFSHLIDKANISKAEQEVKAGIKNVYANNLDLDFDKLVIAYNDDSELEYLFTYKNQELKLVEFDNYTESEKILIVDGIMYYAYGESINNELPNYIRFYSTEDLTEYHSLVVDSRSKLISNDEIQRIEKEYKKGEIIKINLEDFSNKRLLVYLNENVMNKVYINSNEPFTISIVIYEDIVLRIDYIDLYTLDVEDSSKKYFTSSTLEELVSVYDSGTEIVLDPIVQSLYDLDLYLNGVYVTTLTMNNSIYTFEIRENTSVHIEQRSKEIEPIIDTKRIGEFVDVLATLNVYDVDEIIFHNVTSDEPNLLSDDSILNLCSYLNSKENIVSFLTALMSLEYTYTESQGNLNESTEIVSSDLYKYTLIVDEEVLSVSISNSYDYDGKLYVLKQGMDESVDPSMYNPKLGYMFNINNAIVESMYSNIYINNPDNEQDLIAISEDKIDLRRLVLQINLNKDNDISSYEVARKYIKANENYYEVINSKYINISDIEYKIISSYNLEEFTKENIFPVVIRQKYSGSEAELFKMCIDNNFNLEFITNYVENNTDYQVMNFKYYAFLNGEYIDLELINSYTEDFFSDIESIVLEYDENYHYNLTVFDEDDVLVNNDSLSGMYHSGEIIEIEINSNIELGNNEILLVTETSDQRFIQTKYNNQELDSGVQYNISITKSDVIVKFAIVTAEEVTKEIYLKDINKDVKEIVDLGAECVREIVYIPSHNGILTDNVVTKCLYILNNTDQEKDYVYNFVESLSTAKYYDNGITQQQGIHGYYVFTMNDGTSYSFKLDATIRDKQNDNVILKLHYATENFIGFTESGLAKDGLTLINRSMFYFIDDFEEIYPNYVARLYDGNYETSTLVDIRGIILEKQEIENNVIDETKGMNIVINRSSNISEIVKDDNRQTIYVISNNLIRIDSEDSKDYYRVVNDFSFEKYMPCVTMSFIVKIYNVINKEELCVIKYALGQEVTKEMILKHIGSEYSEAKFYDITPKISVINPLVIELFIGEPLIMEGDMEIGVLLEDQVTIEDISI